MSETFSAEPPRPAADESEGSATPEVDLGSTELSGSGDDFDIDFGGDFSSGSDDDLDINLDFGGESDAEESDDDFDIDLGSDEAEEEPEDSSDEDEASPPGRGGARRWPSTR